MRLKVHPYSITLKIIAVVLLSVSCKGNVEKDAIGSSEGVYALKFDKDISEYSTISNVEILEIIQLETYEESLLGDISKVQRVQDNWYISSMSNLFAFKANGAFIRTVGKIGAGPGEINEVTDFWIDPDQKEIIVLDTRGKKL